MNGAAMDCRQDRVLRSQHRDPSGLHSPGYHLHPTMKHPRQQNSHPQHSKAINYQSLSDSFLVDGSSEYLQHKDRYSLVSRNRPTSGDVLDPRTQDILTQNREPLELPVPRFEIDENCVSESLVTKENSCSLVKNSTDLDLDTRIDLLIKSKALAGMHPIFCELAEEGSSNDSNRSLSVRRKIKHKLTKRCRSSPSEEQVSLPESFDDPETPLSRPPSPFLSRATYLFCFNKAIELKELAKAQEQALLEKAKRRLLQDNISPGKTNQTVNSNREDKPLLKTILNEINKEFKEIVKQEFIRKVLENTAFSTLDDWWEKQSQLEEEKLMESSVPNEQVEFSNKSEIDSVTVCSDSQVECQGSTSPKVPFPWGNEGRKLQEKLCIDESQINDVDKDNTSTNLLSKTSIIGSHNSTKSNVSRGEGNLLEDNNDMSMCSSSLASSSYQNSSFSRIEITSNETDLTTDIDITSDHANDFSGMNEGKTNEGCSQTVKNIMAMLVNSVDRQTLKKNVQKNGSLAYGEVFTLTEDNSKLKNDFIDNNEDDKMKHTDFSDVILSESNSKGILSDCAGVLSLPARLSVDMIEEKTNDNFVKNVLDTFVRNVDRQICEKNPKTIESLLHEELSSSVKDMLKLTSGVIGINDHDSLKYTGIDTLSESNCEETLSDCDNTFALPSRSSVMIEDKTNEEFVKNIFDPVVERQAFQKSPQQSEPLIHKELSTLIEDSFNLTSDFFGFNEQEKLKQADFSKETLNSSENKCDKSLLPQEEIAASSTEIATVQNNEPEDCLQGKENIPTQLQELTGDGYDKNRIVEGKNSDCDLISTSCSNPAALRAIIESVNDVELLF